MSVLEIWQVKYRESGDEKSQSFNWFDWERLKKFVEDHDVVSVIFSATGLPNGPAKTMSKNVYEEELRKEDVAMLSDEWIADRRKKATIALLLESRTEILRIVSPRPNYSLKRQRFRHQALLLLDVNGVTASRRSGGFTTPDVVRNQLSTVTLAALCGPLRRLLPSTV